MTRASLVAVCLTLAGGMLSLWLLTDGFRAVTSEGARRLVVESANPEIPDLRLEDQNGRMFRLSELRGQAVAIEFIYTRCPMLCQVLGDTFATVLTSLSDGAAHLKLLSITFDPVNDRATELHAYAEATERTVRGGSWRGPSISAISNACCTYAAS